MTDTRWRSVRCQSDRCETPGGRVLAVEHPDGWVMVKRARQALLSRGDIAVLVCSCGWTWHNPALAPPSLDGALLCETPAVQEA